MCMNSLPRRANNREFITSTITTAGGSTSPVTASSSSSLIPRTYLRKYKLSSFLDEFVCKEPVLFVGNQMENMKNFFSSFVDEFVLPQVVDPVQHVTQLIPSKCSNSVVEIKESTIDSNANNPKEAPLVHKELCHKPSSIGLCHSEQTTSEISQHLIGQRDSIINKTSDNTTQVNRSEDEGVLYDGSLYSDATAFEYSDWGIENIIDLDLDIDNMNLKENKTPLNRPVDELECGSNTSTAQQSSELESSITCNENKQENAKHIIAGGLSSEKLHSSFGHSNAEPDTIDCNPTVTVDYFSVSSDILSSCGSFRTLAYDSSNEAGGSTDDFEDVKTDSVESCVIVEGGKLSAFPSTSRSKSYKKMIQDAFMSRKRLTKEYKQLAIWYGDIDKELCQPTGDSSKQPAQDLPDSEWELL
ncbi:hypothetical protein L1987_26685 [Smallanthus sonchifolius]|uniref:Uncharacterized protein n=1 Tax=Smallanthus sonchifolius TaxID=185202 RepID=A0ACB9IAK8_9ASTR|nr:hypothetical protein L1987_26685 [Smallanthus sonchifolius]